MNKYSLLLQKFENPDIILFPNIQKVKSAGIAAKCVICKKIFYKFARARSGRRRASLRKSTDITCSHKCSRVHCDIKSRRAKIKN